MPDHPHLDDVRAADQVGSQLPHRGVVIEVEAQGDVVLVQRPFELRLAERVDQLDAAAG
jgi:hypothetical protein